VIGVAPGVIGRWVLRILRRAAAAGMDVRPLATGVAARRIDPLALFGAAVSQDALRLDAFATVEGDDHDALRGLAPLIARPMLRDLGTRGLDVVALERDYRRPAAPARRMAVDVVAPPSRWRDLLGLRL